LCINVSSKSKTRQYFLPDSSWPKNGGVTLGRFVKLLGNTALDILAIADAFKIENGFLPVREV